MSYVKFSGSSIWSAIVDHHSLDITEEDEFLSYCKTQKAVEVHSDKYRDWSVKVSIDELERLYHQWERDQLKT